MPKAQDTLEWIFYGLNMDSLERQKMLERFMSLNEYTTSRE